MQVSLHRRDRAGLFGPERLHRRDPFETHFYKLPRQLSCETGSTRISLRFTSPGTLGPLPWSDMETDPTAHEPRTSPPRKLSVDIAAKISGPGSKPGFLSVHLRCNDSYFWKPPQSIRGCSAEAGSRDPGIANRTDTPVGAGPPSLQETVLGLSHSNNSSGLPVTPSTFQSTFVPSPPVLIL